MKYGLVGAMVPILFEKPIYEYTKQTLPDLDMADYKKKHKKEYKAMVERTPGIGGMKDNMFAIVMYLACYGFSYYRALGDRGTLEIFDGMIDALCSCDTMKRLYKNKNCFDQKEIDKYVRGSERSRKQKFEMDWLFDFSYDLSVPEYYVTHRQCGVCKLGKQEHLEFLVPYMCKTDYPTIEYKGGKLIRTKTLAEGADCCDFHVVKPE